MELMEQDKVMWRQRSKCLWLKEGNRNMRFFHVMASCRRRNNRVVRIMDKDNNWWEKENDIK